MICIKNNINGKFANLDAAKDFENISTNVFEFDCSLSEIAPVKYPFE